MKITVNPTFEWNDDQGKYVLVTHDGQYEADPEMLFDRAAQKAATQQQNAATANASQYGGQAAAINAPLNAYDTQNLNNPQGIGQQGVHELLTSTAAGAGGTTSSLVGAENMAAKRGTTGPSSSVLDDIARQREKGVAGASADIASQDVMLKQKQRSQAADDLSRRYGIDVNAQLGQEGAANAATNTEIKAGQSGWFQNLMAGLGTAEKGFSALYGGAGGGGAFSPGGAFGS